MKRETQQMSMLIREYVAEIDHNAENILYGSKARIDQRHYSDWDVVILTYYTADLETECKFRDKLYELELATGDYEDLYQLNQETVEPLFKPCHEMIAIIDNLIRKP
ncbi:hypothetical protein [Saccharicrinis sp. GN24d3]|uniref:hypothetical protein n=1 Tax=Saccharicrinis sp. GN24d3 TaxID=3458416 RepID=UPI0040351C61